jgi:hypothetical protein
MERVAERIGPERLAQVAETLYSYHIHALKP